MSMNELSDPWALPGNHGVPTGATPVFNQAEGPASPVQVDVISDITPLGPRPGPDAEHAAPAPLHPVLFGPDAALYTILDASRIANLDTILAASGLEHKCLFQGDAKDELGEVAPWLVRLEEGAALTRRLFVRHPEGKITPFHLWDAHVGIFIRAEASLDEVWRHFRRFTRVPDETGAWFYFRFWEPEVAALYFPSIGADLGRAQHWLRGPNECAIQIISCRPRLSDAVSVKPSAALPMGRPNAPFVIGPIERDVFHRVALGKFQRDLNDHMHAALPEWERGTEVEQRLAQLRALIREAKGAGLGVEQATVFYCEAALRMGRSPMHDPITARILQKDQHPVDAARALLAHAQSLTAR